MQSCKHSIHEEWAEYLKGWVEFPKSVCFMFWVDNITDFTSTADKHHRQDSDLKHLFTSREDPER